MDRLALQDAFDGWVRKVVQVQMPQWLDPDTPHRWVDQASEAELEAMIDEAKQEGRTRPQGGLLVLIVGTTPVACLLSAFWRRPDRLIVAGSNDPAGRAAADRLEDELRRRFGQVVSPGVRFPPTDPVAIVEALSQRLDASHRDRPEDRGRTALDITGGKKPMVAAAFFLAALRRDIELSYVDGRYDPRVRLPEPCTARVEVLGNPGVALGLFALDEARALWEVGAYRAAEQRLMSAGERLGPDRVAAQRNLARAVVAWEDLAYDHAVDIISAPLPEAVHHLGARWRTIRAQAKAPRDWHRALRGDPWHVLLHVVDVLHWARRRGGAREQRSLFLTLYALGELLFGAVLRHDLSPQVNDFDSLWDEIKRGGGASKWLFHGSSMLKSTKASVTSLPEAGPWRKQDWKDLRDNAAHGLAVIDATHVAEVSSALDKLVRATAARIGSAPDPHGADASLLDAVTAWLAPGCPWFTVPPWVHPG